MSRFSLYANRHTQIHTPKCCRYDISIGLSHWLCQNSSEKCKHNPKSIEKFSIQSNHAANGMVRVMQVCISTCVFVSASFINWEIITLNDLSTVYWWSARQFIDFESNTIVCKTQNPCSPLNIQPLSMLISKFIILSTFIPVLHNFHYVAYICNRSTGQTIWKPNVIHEDVINCSCHIINKRFCNAYPDRALCVCALPSLIGWIWTCSRASI